MFLKTLIAAFTLLSSAALAADVEAGFHLRVSGQPVLCERELTAKGIQSRQEKLADHVFDRPYVTYATHEMTDAGLAKMGQPPHTSDRELSNLVLVASKPDDQNRINISLQRFENGRFESTFDYSFENSKLVSWAGLVLDDAQEKWDYRKLIREFPADADKLARGVVGYHSPPDADGVRHFLQIHKGSRDISSMIDFGIDVPCDQIQRYTEDILEVIDILRSPEGEFCRISVLSFGRIYSDLRP